MTTETTGVVGQGPDGPIVSVCGAELRRSDSGLSARLGMPTPVLGAYDYPPPNMFRPVVIAGEQPEVYSLWMFVFNFPEPFRGAPLLEPLTAEVHLAVAFGYRFSISLIGGQNQITRGLPTHSRGDAK